VSDVHALPSSGHIAPVCLSTIEQPPLPLHVALCWQLVGVHAYAVPPHDPAIQTSFDVQALPSLHVVPSGVLDQLVVEVVGEQAWQALAALIVPAP
jgi:hypothetical protein